MKEQGKDFDPSKEPVTEGTIRALLRECEQIIKRKPDEVDDVESKYVGIFKETTRKITSEGGRHIWLAWNDYPPKIEHGDHGEKNVFIGDHTSTAGLDLYQVSVRVDKDRLGETGEIPYSYIIGSGRVLKEGKYSNLSTELKYFGREVKEDPFMLFFLTPPQGCDWWHIETGLSSEAKQKAKELLSEGKQVGKLNLHKDTKESSFPDSPFYSVVEPSEEHSRRLLDSLKRIKRIRITPEKWPL